MTLMPMSKAIVIVIATAILMIVMMRMRAGATSALMIAIAAGDRESGYDAAAVVAAVFTLCYASNLVRKLLL